MCFSAVQRICTHDFELMAVTDLVFNNSNLSYSHVRNRRHLCIISHHTTLHYIISHHIIPHHIKSYHIIPHHIISYHIIPHHVISHHIISHYIKSHYISSHHSASYHITSYHITSHHVIDTISLLLYPLHSPLLLSRFYGCVVHMNKHRRR